MVVGLVAFFSLSLVGGFFAFGVFDAPNKTNSAGGGLFDVSENCEFGGLFGCPDFGVFSTCLSLDLENSGGRDLVVEKITVNSNVLAGDNCGFVLGQTSSQDGFLRAGETGRFVLNSAVNDCGFTKTTSKKLNEYKVNVHYSWESNRGDTGVVKGKILSSPPTIDSNLCKGVLNGVCGSSVHSCKIGKYVDLTTNQGNPIWHCEGYNGGLNTTCKPIDGVCNDAQDSCDSGEARPILGNNTHYFWYCKGLHGGIDSGTCNALRSFTEPSHPNKGLALSGECGTERNTCVNGNPIARNSNNTHHRWYCRGFFGGSTDDCSVCAPIPGGWSRYTSCDSSSGECGWGYQHRHCNSPSPSCGGTCSNGKLKESISCYEDCDGDKMCSNGQCVDYPKCHPTASKGWGPCRIFGYGNKECGDGWQYCSCYKGEKCYNTVGGFIRECYKYCYYGGVCSNGLCE